MSLLRDAIASLDPAPNIKSELTFSLSVLTELCEQKAAELRYEIEKGLYNTEDKNLPITEIVSSHKEFRAYTPEDAIKITPEASSSLGRMLPDLKPDMIEGIARLATKAIEEVVEGRKKQIGSYYVAIEPFSIIRVDIRLWGKKIEVFEINSKIETALAFVVTKSIVDVKKVSLNTFINLYTSQLRSMNLSSEKFIDYIETARQTYKKLNQVE